MKILHTVESYLPARHGMSEVVRQISEYLAAMGHEVVVATRKDPNRTSKDISGVHIEEFSVSGSWAYGMRGEVGRYCQYMLESRFDIVTNFAGLQWATDAILPILNSIRGKKVFVPTGFSGLFVPELQEYFSQMPEWLSRYDRVVYLSENYRDANFAKQNGLRNGILIPNGASQKEFSDNSEIDIRQVLGIPPDDLLVLHVSGYVDQKGHTDAIDIFSQSGLENATLLFICPNLTPENVVPTSWPAYLTGILLDMVRKRNIKEMRYLPFKKLKYSLQNRINHRRIQFTSLTRPEVVAAYHAADLMLFPSHLECSPIVLFEAMASKTPFLSTDVGNAREIANWSSSGEILPTHFDNSPYRMGRAEIDASAKMLTDLGLDPVRRREMAEAGYSAWQDKFTWEKISASYLELYEKLLAE